MELEKLVEIVALYLSKNEDMHPNEAAFDILMILEDHGALVYEE